MRPRGLEACALCDLGGDRAERRSGSTSVAEIPVITVTASESLNVGMRAKVLSLGASDYLTKPFDLDMLMQEIMLFVQKRE
jgi:DNA-binding response OmpR family regulator